MIDHSANQTAVHLCFLDMLGSVPSNQAPHDWHGERERIALRAEHWFKAVGNYPRWLEWRELRRYHEAEAARLVALRQRDLI